MQGIARGTGYGYSLWEFQVFGLGTEQVAVPVPGGAHAWQVRATDGAGNTRTSSNAPLLLTSLTPFMQWQIQVLRQLHQPRRRPQRRCQRHPSEQPLQIHRRPQPDQPCIGILVASGFTKQPAEPEFRTGLEQSTLQRAIQDGIAQRHLD